MTEDEVDKILCDLIRHWSVQGAWQVETSRLSGDVGGDDVIKFLRHCIKLGAAWDNEFGGHVAQAIRESSTPHDLILTRLEIGRAQVAEPPKLAQFLLVLFLDRRHVDGLIGDLAEQFERDCRRYDADYARRRYWAETLRSLWPLLRRAMARAIKWVAVLEAVRKFFF